MEGKKKHAEVPRGASPDPAFLKVHLVMTELVSIKIIILGSPQLSLPRAPTGLNPACPGGHTSVCSE